MTSDSNLTSRTGSEELGRVLDRAWEGRTLTYGMGPFFITIHSSVSGRTRMLPTSFPSAETALLFLGMRLVDDPTFVEPGSWVTICFRLSSQWIQ